MAGVYSWEVLAYPFIADVLKWEVPAYRRCLLKWQFLACCLVTAEMEEPAYGRCLLKC